MKCNFTQEEKKIIRDAMDVCALKVRFTASEYGVKIEVRNDQLGITYKELKHTVGQIMDTLRLRKQINFKTCFMTSGGGSKMRFNVRMRDYPVKTTIDRINIEKYPAKANKFEQLPEVGDYIIGNKAGRTDTLFIAEILGWDSSALIVKNIMGYGRPGDIETMRWRENIIFPKDTFKDNLESFLVMMKLSMELE